MAATAENPGALCPDQAPVSPDHYRDAEHEAHILQVFDGYTKLKEQAVARDADGIDRP